MHRRSLIIIAIVAILVVAGGTVGIVQARAQGEPSLAAVTPAELLAKVAHNSESIASVSGDVTWKNDVLGLSMLSFGGQGTGDATSLLASGSGRVWVQDGKARLEIQGAMGDTTAIGDSTTSKLWVYSSTKNTATEYTLPAKLGDAADSAEPSTVTSIADPVTTIEQFLQKMAPDASLAVSDAVKVAGRDCYVLSLVPKAPNTVFGSAQVAIDAETYLPLKLDLYAKGTSDAVLTAGFTNVSYDDIADSVFTFAPPANATVEHKELSFPAMNRSTTDDKSPDAATGEPGTLTIAQATAKAGFTPPTARTTDPALAFAGAYVIPAQQVDIGALLGKLGQDGMGDLDGFGPSASGPVTIGPVVIQRYGSGFGTTILAEAKVPSDLVTQLEQTLAMVPLLSRTNASGVTIYQLNSALGSLALWSKDGLLFVAAGSVSQTDLTEFIASVR